MPTFNDLLEYYLSNPLICWGVGPSVCMGIAILTTTLSLEWLASQKWMEDHLITYGKHGNRQKALNETWKKVPLREQMMETTFVALGPINIASSFSSRYLYDYVYGEVPSAAQYLPSMLEIYMQTCLILLIFDFVFYWAHRVQHENPRLFAYHARHHDMITTSAWSGAVLNPFDAVIAVAMPMFGSAALMRPHPITLAVALSVLQSLIIQAHAGIHVWWLKWITLRVFIPFHASEIQHDYHHHYVGQGPVGKNFGMFLWIWDWLFGTLCIPESLVNAKKGMEPSHVN